MSNINVTQSTQRIIVNMPSRSVSVVAAGPQGPAGPMGDNGVTIGENPPAGPQPDDIWINTANMKIYVYYNDGTSMQWVEAGQFDPGAIDPATLAASSAMQTAFVNASGDTMTGDLKIDKNGAPNLVLKPSATNHGFITWQDSNGVNRVYMFRRGTNGRLEIHLMDSAGNYQRTPFLIDADGGYLQLTGAAYVTVPEPTTGLSAATRNYADGKVDKTGDTMTGNLTVDKSSPIIALDSDIGSAGQFQYKRNGVVRWNFSHVSSEDRISFYRYDENGVFVDTPLSLNADGSLYVAYNNANVDMAQLGGTLIRRNTTTNGDALLKVSNGSGVVRFRVNADNVDIGGATSVTVPSITGANQAAQVTAYDAATGRLAVGGHEIGDTGWRNIDASLSSDWTGTGSVLRVRRAGDTVHIMMNVYPTVIAADPPTTIVPSIPSGFRNTNPAGWSGASDFLCYAESGANNPSLAVVRVVTAIQVLTGVRLLDNPTFVRGQITYTTTDAWPTSLPGTAA